MFLHHLINSPKERVARKILINQAMQGREKKNWYNEVVEKAESIGIEIKILKMEEIKKSEWKRAIKQKIKDRIEKDIQEKAECSKKLRFLKGKKFEKEKYFQI